MTEVNKTLITLFIIYALISALMFFMIVYAMMKLFTSSVSDIEEIEKDE